MSTITIISENRSNWIYCRDGNQVFVGPETKGSQWTSQMQAHDKMRGFAKHTGNHRDLMGEAGVCSIAAPGYRLAFFQRLFWKRTQKKLEERLRADCLPVTTA